MILSAIVATAKNNVIGKNNQIPWYLPADLKYFKRVTTGHHVIMGRKCYESIGRPLPNRTNIVITRDAFFISSNCLIARNIKEALEIAFDNEEKEAFIIGGGEIYNQTQEFWDKLYITEVDLEVEGDVFFPSVDLQDWTLMDKQCHQKDDKNEFDYCFKVYDRNE